MSTILQVKDLKVTFPIHGKPTPAVDGMSFKLEQGKILGIVGESGCGKTMTALSLLRLIESPGKIASGQALFFGEVNETLAQKYEVPFIKEKTEKIKLIPSSNTPSDIEQEHTPLYDGSPRDPDEFTTSVLLREEEPMGGIDLYKLTEPEIRSLRGNKIAMIFQEPMTSLNPVFKVGDQIMEAILLHQKTNKREARDIAIEMLKKVKIPDPEKRIQDYPHQMSGGMRQRVMIAMALCCQPDILIADEPTTALDVTIQAQILELIQELISDMHMSVILITHDLGVVAQVCDEVIVMYSGMVIEQAPVNRLFRRPKHPYTLGLMKSIPQLFESTAHRLSAIAGTVPPLHQLPEGCRFANRCNRALKACHREIPKFKYVGEGQHLRCLNY